MGGQVVMKVNNTSIEKLDAGPKTLWNRHFIIVLVFGFIAGSANQMVNPQLSKYAVSLGATLSLAGTIVGLQSATAMFLRPLSGAASDILNRKFVMIGSIMMTSLAFLGYLAFHSVTSIIVFRVIQGFGFAFMSVARTAFATEFIPKERMGEGVALTSFGVVLSQAVGPAVGLWISDKWGYNVCFSLALGFSISGILLLSTLPYKFTKGKFNKSKLKLKNLIAIEVFPYAFLAGLFALTTHMANSFLALMADERGIPNVALFFTVYSIAALVLRPLAGRILDKYGLPVLLYPAFIFASLCMVMLGMASSIGFIIIAGLFKALSQGVAISSIQGSGIKRLGKDRAGVSSATIHMGQDLIQSLGPIAGGVIATKAGYGTMYYSFAALMLLGIPLYMWIRHSEKKRGMA